MQIWQPVWLPHADHVQRDLLPCACKWACVCWCMSLPVHAHGMATIEVILQVLSACHAGGTLMQLWNALAKPAVFNMSALLHPFMVIEYPLALLSTNMAASLWQQLYGVCAMCQVCMAADECCNMLLPMSAPAAWLALLKPNLPAVGSINTPACPPASLIQVCQDAMSSMASCHMFHVIHCVCILYQTGHGHSEFLG